MAVFGPNRGNGFRLRHPTQPARIAILRPTRWDCRTVAYLAQPPPGWPAQPGNHRGCCTGWQCGRGGVSDRRLSRRTIRSGSGGEQTRMAEATEIEAHDLAALLCSRVCHDIISPVGAITNGLEVLDEEGSDEETKNFAFELI